MATAWRASRGLAAPRRPCIAPSKPPTACAGRRGVAQAAALPDEHLLEIVGAFRAPVRFACGYGSGVFRQASYAADARPMLDLIFGVTHTQHWHSLNLKQHRAHYAGVAALGSGAVAALQDGFGAGVYYNTHVEVAGFKIKYGVVQMDTLVRDLESWETMYLAGRFQKPINILRSDPRVQLANNANRLAALRTALLLLPTEFTTHDLLTHIVGLSYSGDFRTMIGAENPNKVSNIATAQAELLWEIYGPLVDQLNDVLVRRSADNWVQATDPKTRARLVANLPLAFRRRIYEQFSRTGSVAIGKDGAADQGSLAMGVASSLEMSEWIRKALVRTVAYPALTQSIKGIATAGILRSVTYSFEKLKKGRQKS